jgi:Protein of unknown function (DUF1501)
MIIKAEKSHVDASEKFAQKYPHHHESFFRRPDFSRRRFFEMAGAGVLGSFLAGRGEAADSSTAGVATKGTAKNVIFILLQGAISGVDTFDFKNFNGVTPANFQASKINGIDWPAGLLPKLGGALGDIALVRSMSAWALVHSLAQTWQQIGRNPAAALGNIAPNIGSVVAIEKDKERTPSQVFPTFVALNTPTGPGPGYFPATYAPFRVGEGRNATSKGINNTTNSANQTNFNTMFSRLHQIDDSLRKNSPYGSPLQDYDAFYSAANGLMYNPTVQSAFGFTADDSARYGSSAFGNSCLVAKQILAANQGTRYIEIQIGGWDMHTDIYGQTNPAGSNLFTLAPQLDAGVAALLADLKASGALSETLVVMGGEFGRTAGISAAGGRDHYLNQTVVFAGAGVKGGKVIGATSADPTKNTITTTDYGWNGSGNTGPRFVRPEDVEATIYSAMGIDWTTVRMDDPFHRGFEYVPFASSGTYGPINELWT